LLHIKVEFLMTVTLFLSMLLLVIPQSSVHACQVKGAVIDYTIQHSLLQRLAKFYGNIRATFLQQKKTAYFFPE